MNNQLPLYWWLLSSNDVCQYNVLRTTLSTIDIKNKYNKKNSTFKQALDAVKKFAMRGDSMDKIRCLVCGIIWLPDGIGVNTHQLKLIISRCKSSINGSLQKLGFTENLGRTASASTIISVYPFLKENSTELRKWSVRRKPKQNQSKLNEHDKNGKNTNHGDISGSTDDSKEENPIFVNSDEFEKFYITDSQDNIF